MMRLLVSVRDVPEALAAAAAGADYIDLKEPGAGALGGLPVDTIRHIVAALREAHPRRPVSATIGDIAAGAAALIETRVAAVGGCGVDYVKVGIAGADPAATHALLQRLAALPWSVIPVFIADRGVDFAALDLACALPFPALMVDTQDKLAGSLFDCMPGADLERFVRRVRAAGKRAGLAGALREGHLQRLRQVAPDFAGFRSAVCHGARSGTLAPQRVRRLRAALGDARAASVDAAADALVQQ